MTATDPSDRSDEATLDVLLKVDAIMTILASEKELRAQDIAERLQEPLSSTYRLLRQLVDTGWLNKRPHSRKYRLGLMVFKVGKAVGSRIDLRVLAAPPLKQLVAQTGFTSYLSIRRGMRVVCIERIDGQRVGSSTIQLGSSLPLWAGAGSMTILAFTADEDRNNLIDSMQQDGKFAMFKDKIVENVTRIRKHGYAVSDGDVTPGIAAIGAPVFDRRGSLAAAITISSLRVQVLGNTETLAARVISAARTVSASLGFHPGASAC